MCLFVIVENVDGNSNKNFPTEEPMDFEEVVPLSVIEVLAKQKEEMNLKKLQIAQISLNVVENPNENVRNITNLIFISIIGD